MDSWPTMSSFSDICFSIIKADIIAFLPYRKYTFLLCLSFIRKPSIMLHKSYTFSFLVSSTLVTKYARGVPISPRSLSGSFLPPALQQLLHLTDNSRDDHTLVIKLWL